jgi:hypothetical protein
MQSRAVFAMLDALMLKTRPGTRPAAVARFVLAAATLVPSLLPGCPAPRPYAADAGRADAPRVSPRTLIAQSGTNVALTPGAETLIRVLLRDDASGAPIANETVHFGLEGNPRGSTLRALDVQTNAEGIAEVAIVAGATSTTFVVRASATEVDAITFSVSVGAAFGTLRVDVDAQHTAPVDSYLARVALGTSCATLDAASVVVTRTLGAEFAEADFINLATDAAWTVDLRGVARDGTVTARGCVDDLAVRAGETTTVSIAVTDRMIELSPRYDVALSFDAREAGATTALLLTPSGEDALTSATVLLDALDAELASRLLVEPRARLREARAAGLEARVAAQLALRETSFVRELSALTSEVDAALSATTLEGSLVLSPARLEFRGGSVAEGVFTSALPTTLTSLAISPTEVTLRGASIELRASTLWLTALRLEASRADSRVQSGPLCSSLAGLTADLSIATCTGDCLAAACTRAVDLYVQTLERRAVAVDSEVSTLTFGTVLRATDTDRDFVAETLASPDFVARWSSADSMTAIPLTVRWSASSGAPL